MKRSFTATTTALITAVLTTTSALADTIHVPEDYLTVQEGIDAALNGDEILLADGEYTGPLNKNLLFLGKAITLRSESGNREACTIDCQGDGRFATFTAGDTAVVRSITVVNGNAGTGNGGAVRALLGSSPSFIDCVFQHCAAAEYGGALYDFGADVTVEGCLFEDNVADNGGGVRVTDNGTLTCSDCSFINNVSTRHGGGLYIHSSAGPGSRLSGCRFTNNQAGFIAGGARIGTPIEEVSNCIFECNVAGGAGGGLWISGTTRVENVVFLHNTALFGGGVGLSGSSGPTSPEFVNCLFAGNRAIAGQGKLPAGGGMEVFGAATPTLINCSFSGNSSEEFGGAVNADEGSDVQLVNCVLWGNDAPDGAQIHIGYPGFEGGTVTVSYSDVAGGEGGVSTCFGCVLEWGEGNIDCDPLFDEHYRLSAGSCAIDAADNTAVPKDVTDDIDGRPRFVDDPDTNDTGNGEPPLVDMGAHEFQTCPADLDRNGLIGFGDILAVLAAWGPYAPCPPAVAEDIDHDCQVGFSDLLAVLSAWGPCE